MALPAFSFACGTMLDRRMMLFRAWYGAFGDGLLHFVNAFFSVRVYNKEYTSARASGRMTDMEWYKNGKKNFDCGR